MFRQVLSADAFSAFEEVLGDDAAVRDTGRRFRDTVLALGGGRAPDAVFRVRAEPWNARPGIQDSRWRRCSSAVQLASIKDKRSAGLHMPCVKGVKPYRGVCVICCKQLRGSAQLVLSSAQPQLLC
jgi:hypothetical protein